MLELEDAFYFNYDGRVKIDEDILLVMAWNEYAKNANNGEEIIHLNNDKMFFECGFKNKYDAVWAVSLSDKWSRVDRFVYFNFKGYLTSFNHWDDEKSPIDIEKIDINNLININKKRYVNNIHVNNIPRAIHDALKEV